MTMVKVIPPGSQNFGEQVAQIVKVSSRGLLGSDLSEFVKRSDHYIADAARGVDLKPGEDLIHMIAVGSGEAYGNNRNGDRFLEDVCIKQHPTFVKYAKFYRDHHNNRPPHPSYGLVKFSTFNDRAKRIELLVALNRTKEAAERNKGLVADKELEKLNKMSDIAVSMSCTLPFDVCSSCGHKSASVKEYCDEKSCERGGLKDNITKVCSDGHILCADNPNAKFFDISHVFRPADRIAWVLGHVKTASGSVISGARLAEHWGIRPPYELVSEGLEPDIGRYVKLACMLAELEGRFTQEPILRHSSLNQSFNRFLRQPSRGLTDFAKSASQRKQLAEALHQQQALLSLPDFLMLEGSSLRQAEANSDKIAACLPDIYSRLIARPDLEEVLGKNPYLQTEKVTPSSEVRFWVDKQARALSLEQRFVDERVLRATLHGNTVPTLQVLEKSAAASDDEKRAAERFALYKLALLGRWDGTSVLPHLAEMVVRQNYLPGAP
jgi:hypothetical protein